jgi:hypothetical protein
MQKFTLSFILFLISFPLLAKPYFAEYREEGRIIVFHGNIEEKNEPRVRLLQTQYLESLKVFSRKTQFEAALNRLGVTVEEIRDEPSISSEKAKTLVSPSTQNSGAYSQSSSTASPSTQVQSPRGPPEDRYMREAFPYDLPPNDPYFYP